MFKASRAVLYCYIENDITLEYNRRLSFWKFDIPTILNLS